MVEPLTDKEAAARNRVMIVRMRELERLGIEEKQKRLAEVRPIHGRHQKKKGA